MDEKKLRSAHFLGLLALFILLILSGGFISGELKRVSLPEQHFLPGNYSDNNIPSRNYNKDKYAKGHELFTANCQRCHLVDRKMVGPPLHGVQNRWADSTNLYTWIKNSQKFLQTGDKYSNDLYRHYNTIMPPFPELKDADIESILYFINKSDISSESVQ